MTLMTVCAELHEAWRKDGKAAALKVWKKLEALADSMSLYYIPLAYNNRAPGVDCKDALSRSQLRETLDRCRAKLAG
jgi:hypothetical protein